MLPVGITEANAELCLHKILELFWLMALHKVAQSQKKKNAKGNKVPWALTSRKIREKTENWQLILELTDY